LPPIREPIKVAMDATLLIPPNAIPCCSFGISDRAMRKRRSGSGRGGRRGGEKSPTFTY
jgi:hypothetical protein